MKLYLQKPINNQRGATLLVALVLLLLMTIVAVGATQVSKMQMQMARNTQFELTSYQLTLTALNTQLAVLQENNTAAVDLKEATNKKDFTDAELYINDALKDLGEDGEEDDKTLFSNSNVKASGSIEFKGNGRNNSGNLGARFFEITVDTKLGNVGSNQTLGVQMLQPKLTMQFTN